MKWKARLGLTLGTLLVACHLGAGTLAYTGTLATDDQVKLFNYTVSAPSSILFSTNSYQNGGFVPVISLFNSAGTAIGSNGGDGFCHAGMKADATTGMCDDAYLMQMLQPGSYTLALTEFFNVPVGPTLADGFLMSGTGNFTGATCGASGGFYQTDIAPCVQRANSYSLLISDVPEPASVGLVVMSLASGAIYYRRRRSSVATSPVR